MRLRRLGLAVLAAAGLAGCATPAAVEQRRPAAELPQRAEVAGVPFEPQDQLYCGPAALAMALSWSGSAAGPGGACGRGLHRRARRHAPGDHYRSRRRRHDRLAVPVGELGDLLAELRGRPPGPGAANLGLDAWPVWHYAVAVGYDQVASDLVLRSGARRGRVALATFERT